MQEITPNCPIARYALIDFALQIPEPLGDAQAQDGFYSGGIKKTIEARWFPPASISTCLFAHS
jgi:hypothetical protein